MALAGCSCVSYRHVATRVADGRKLAAPKSGTPIKLAPSRSRVLSQSVETANFATPEPATPIRPPAAALPASKSETANLATPKPATPIPLPAAALLVRQEDPSCEPTGATDERQKLDYERQCYRHAEIIDRSRLQLLQSSVDRTISALKGTPFPVPAASLLSAQPEPSCEFQNPKTDELQKLDYERQCYRHAEMIVRNRLKLLQDAVDKTISALKRSEQRQPP
jgi:hypothetical protein